MDSINERTIIFVAGLHGNEQAPVKALKDNSIEFILGNPKAYQENKRFTEYDLNAAFGLESNSYEKSRAEEILKELDRDSLVVDFHTTGAETEPFAIVVDEKMIPLAARTGLKHIVIMRLNIKEGHALINYRDGISVESGRHDAKTSYETTLKIIKNIRGSKTYPAQVYEVYGRITKPGTYINFQEHPDSFIPVLAGEPLYDFYGLKARMVPIKK